MASSFSKQTRTPFFKAVLSIKLSVCFLLSTSVFHWGHSRTSTKILQLSISQSLRFSTRGELSPNPLMVYRWVVTCPACLVLQYLLFLVSSLCCYYFSDCFLLAHRLANISDSTTVSRLVKLKEPHSALSLFHRHGRLYFVTITLHNRNRDEMWFLSREHTCTHACMQTHKVSVGCRL